MALQRLYLHRGETVKQKVAPPLRGERGAAGEEKTKNNREEMGEEMVHGDAVI